MKRVFVLVALFAVSAFANRLVFEDRFRLVSPSDPQISPDNRSIAFVVSRTNTKENRYDTELDVIDIASGAVRPLTFERRGIAQPRWSPDGRHLAFLAMNGADREAKRQIWMLPTSGGDARRLTDAAQGVQQFAWSPDGTRIAFVAADEPPKKSETDTHNRAFEVGDDDFLIRAEPTPSHVWIIGSGGGTPKRLTSGSWSIPSAHPPGPVPSPLSWSPDGKLLAISQLETAHSSAGHTSRIAILDVDKGAIRRITKAEVTESHPLFSPDGSSIAYLHPLDGVRLNESHVWIAPISGGAGRDVTHAIDRNLGRAIWMPDGKSILVGGHDGTSTAYWIQPLDGSAARKLDLGDVEPWWGFWIDASVAPNGAISARSHSILGSGS